MKSSLNQQETTVSELPRHQKTLTGHRALQTEEPLLFDIDVESGCDQNSAVDLPTFEHKVETKLGGLERKSELDLPNLSEPQIVRHYTRLSQKNYGIDTGFYPLGSCTMKHNPRVNEKLARLPGFAKVHPLQPQETVQGVLRVMEQLSIWLQELTGLPGVALSPGAGAHGELCGIMAIRAALEDRGEKRHRILIPVSAHGTNPATAVACGFEVDPVPVNDKGCTDLDALVSKLDEDVAGVMITNPNTCGLFEEDIIKIADKVHDIGGYFYCDGANFNAIVGHVKPGDLGVDAMHINLHKTFSTPHGGGGPGSGPVVFCEDLIPYAPYPWVVFDKDQLTLLEGAEGEKETKSFGRLKGFHGQVGMFVRALAYMLSHGKEGLKQVSGDAVLNANYLYIKLKDHISASYEGPVMHEVLFDDRFLKDTGVSTLDFAKALIDEGYHPMTMYFPLIVSGALLIEPTETESKASLDQFIDVMIYLAKKAKSGDVELFKQAPQYTPRLRLDETLAARKPKLKWKR